MRTVGRRQQQRLDAVIEADLGIPVRILMEYAGMAVSREAQQMLADQDCGLPVRVACGHGQNAGDALVAARLLHAAGHVVTCYLDGSPPGTAECAAQLATVQALGIPCQALSDLPIGRALIIDGIFGTGFDAARELPDAVSACFARIQAAHKSGACVLSIDVPSGLDADTAFYSEPAIQADRTVTFLFPKTGLVSDPGKDLAGDIVVDLLGLPAPFLLKLLDQIESGQEQTEWIDSALIRGLAPERPRRMHKGQGGRALLVAGSTGLAGAAILAGEAVLRSGAGLLNLLTDSAQAAAILSRLPESMLTGLEGTSDTAALQKLTGLMAKKPAAVAIGPGIGVNSQSADLLAELIQSALTLIIDADALTLIAADLDRFAPLFQARNADPDYQPAILTPHTGEFVRLMPEAGSIPRLDAARLMARTFGSIVVLKGAATIVASPEGRACINATGNSGLARGGSGDVLTGLLLGLAAQGLNAFDASICAVYLHGLSADLAAADASSRTILPSDVINFLSKAMRIAGWDMTGGTR